MGFYIRKSFNFGPFRLNLSKSGFGFSFGAKGLRYGINARGNEYIHAGRHGLYYREEFKNKEEDVEYIDPSKCHRSVIVLGVVLISLGFLLQEYPIQYCIVAIVSCLTYCLCILLKDNQIK